MNAGMKHAFSGVTADGLIAAITALTDTPRLDDDARPQPQIVTIGRHNQTGEWIVVVADAADGDTTTGEGADHRVFSSEELSHALYSALVDHYAAFDAFKEATGWTPSPKRVKKLVSCAAGRDGDCSHPDCPQLRDKGPSATGRHCPLDK